MAAARTIAFPVETVASNGSARAALLADRLGAWILYVGAFFLPLAYFPDTYDHFILPKLLLASLLVSALLAMRVMRWVTGGTLAIKRTPLDLPVLAFLTSALIATAFSVNRNVAIFGMYLRYEGFLTLALYAALYWLAVQTLATSAQARMLIRALLASAYVVSVFAILQWISASLTVGAVLNPDFSFQGLARAYATMGNPTALAAFLVMMLPAALGEFLDASTNAARIIAANAMVAIGLALGLTFARSAWVAAILAVVIVLAGSLRRRPRLVLSAIGLGLVVALLMIAALRFGPHGGLPLGETLAQRLASIGAGTESSSFRVHVWSDTVPLIESRPLTGFGPDTFGMVFGRFATGAWAPGSVVDKAHAELLQVAATQGGLGVLTYLWLIGSIAVASWRGRAAPGALTALAALAGYQAWVQVNFSWIPAAMPFWLLLGAAIVIWTPAMRTASVGPRWLDGRVRVGGTALGAVFSVLLIAGGAINLIRAHDADARFLSSFAAEAAGDIPTARSDVSEARKLAATQGRYAFEAGRLALMADPSGRVDWWAVREEYQSATRLGTYYPSAYRNLAVADRELGLRREAIEAARNAVEMDPSDASNQAILRDLESR